jgi:hypothetical protein
MSTAIIQHAGKRYAIDGSVSVATDASVCGDVVMLNNPMQFVVEASALGVIKSTCPNVPPMLLARR